MNVQVENVSSLGGNLFKATINGKEHHVKFSPTSDVDKIEIQIFDSQGVGTTGIYDVPSNSLYDSGLHVALLNVVSKPEKSNVQSGGGRFFQRNHLL